MSSSDPSKALLMQHFMIVLTIMLSGMAFYAADTHRATSEGAARKVRLKERCGLEPRTDFFFRLRNRQKLVRIRFGCGLDSRIYSISWKEWLIFIRLKTSPSSCSGRTSALCSGNAWLEAWPQDCLCLLGFLCHPRCLQSKGRMDE